MSMSDSEPFQVVELVDLRMVLSKGSTSKLLPMQKLSQSGQLVQIAKQAVFEGQIVAICKDRLVAMVRTDFLGAFLNGRQSSDN